MKQVPLGEVLDFAGRPERINNPERETFVTVRLYGGGAVKREIKDGKVPVAFTGYRVKSGQFLYSRIDARNGAFALVPPELNNAVVSKDFPTFDVKSQRVHTRYLIHFFRAGRLQRQIRAVSLGATNRQRIPEDRFLAFKMPLPSLDEQQRIAAILDHADTVRAKRRESTSRYANLADAIFLDMFGDPDVAVATGNSILLRDIADLRGGRNLVADDDATSSTFRVLKISAVTSGRFRPDQSKPLPIDYSPPLEHVVRHKDLLISRANTAELVGAVAYIDKEPRNLVLPDKIWRFVFHDQTSIPVYYRSLFQHPSIRRRMSQMASGTGGSMKNISKAKLMELALPRTPPSRQREFEARVAAIPRPSINQMDELVASLQSRAFSGQL